MNTPAASFLPPPEGWFTFGSHVDTATRLVFSEVLGEDGMPLWERPAIEEAGG